MTCPLYGEACTCMPDDRPFDGRRCVDSPRGEASSKQSVVDSPRPKFVVSQNEEVLDAVLQTQAEILPGLEQSSLETPTRDGSHSADPCPTEAQSVVPESPADSEAWRDEVSARLSRYRARRRPRAPRYPSLRLKFEPPPVRASTVPSEESLSTQSASGPLTCQALAMNPVEEEQLAATDVVEEATPAGPETSHSSPISAKILEFPRWAYAPPINLNELADPVVERPRILEVPDVVPPPPAMGGITIEDARPVEAERRPGIDMPLRSAPLGLRVWTGLVDGLIVLLAAAVFGWVFHRLTGARPPLWEMIGLCVGLPCILWAAYQYLFVVFCGTTLGLQAAHLRISRFDGSPVNRRSRRLRVFCSFLSALSLGMGYAWQFLDEDRLCWHERVTRTYLSPSA